MPVTIKQLIDKNKEAFDKGFFIESVNLSYVLINKALKQIAREELKEDAMVQKIKTTSLINHIKKEMLSNVILKKKLSKTIIRDIELFITLFKEINKELKFQFPEKKIIDTSQLGINCIVVLNTSLIKIKNNKVE